MAKNKLLSKSKIPDSFFSVKLRPLPKETQRRLEAAAEQANENIRRNNLIYDSSRAHASGYLVSSGSGTVEHGFTKIKK